MTKEKQASLTKYKNQLADKLASSVVPVKHEGHVNEYKQFLRHELNAVTKQLDAAKLEGGK